MARGDVFEVLWCPDDPYLSPAAPAYPPGDTVLTKSDMAGLLVSNAAPVGMVIQDIQDRMWTVYPHVEDEERVLILLGVEPCGEGYCISDPQWVIRPTYNGLSLHRPKRENICGEWR